MKWTDLKVDTNLHGSAHWSANRRMRSLWSQRPLRILHEETLLCIDDSASLAEKERIGHASVAKHEGITDEIETPLSLSRLSLNNRVISVYLLFRCRFNFSPFSLSSLSPHFHPVRNQKSNSFSLFRADWSKCQDWKKAVSLNARTWTYPQILMFWMWRGGKICNCIIQSIQSIRSTGGF